MISLKHVIHYPDTNSIEATWVEIITPEQIIPASIDAETGAVIPGQIIPVVMQQVRCHSYDQTQMDMLVADLGDDAGQYAELIVTVRANQIPQVAAPRDLQEEARAYLAETRWYVERFNEAGVPVPAEIAAQRAAAWLVL